MNEDYSNNSEYFNPNPEDFSGLFVRRYNQTGVTPDSRHDVNTIILPRIDCLKRYLLQPESSERFISFKEKDLIETIENNINVLSKMFDIENPETYPQVGDVDELVPGSEEWHVAALRDMQQRLLDIQNDTRPNKEKAKEELEWLEAITKSDLINRVGADMADSTDSGKALEN